MTQATEREAYLDYAKGIGIISVVYFHVLVGLEAAGIDQSDFLQWTRFLADSFQMPLFFVVAGFHVSQSLEGRTTASFVTGKLSRLMYPYAIWSLITGGLQVALSSYVNSSITVTDLLSIWYRPLPNQHYWFVATLFLMFMLFLIAVRISQRHYLPILVGAALAPWVLSLHSSERTIELLLTYLPFFVIGIIYTRFSLNRYLRAVSGKALSAIVVFFMLYDFFAWHSITKSATSAIFILAPLGVGIVIMTSIYLAKLGRLDLIRQFGFYSMQIYLAHILFLAGARIFMQKALGVTSVWIHIPIETSVGLILPVLLYKLAIRYNIPYLFELPRKKSIQVNVSDKKVAENG
jgi:fucose 4-O-acetylase-like acetyltransferase